MYAKALKEAAYNLSVLYVEDDEVVADSFGTFLGKFFKQVTVVLSAKEALSIYGQDKFDVVIADVCMPTMDGLQLMDAIQKIDETQRIVVTSASENNTETLIELVNKGVFGFIKKPVDTKEAQRILSKVCGQLHDKQMLMHYLEELERLQQEALHIKCRTDCPMKIVLEKAPERGAAAPIVADDDDFFFFDSSAASKQEQEVDNSSMYRDYFSQLLAEDKEELADVLGDIDSLLLTTTENDGSLPRLGSMMQRYGNVLLHYQFFSDMGSTIVELGAVISSGSFSVSEAKGIIGGFCTVLQNFMKEVWYEEAQNPKFFNDSIVNDARTIISMIATPKASSNDDLVFF
jgi:CheY-like chemotaxis protein